MPTYRPEPTWQRGSDTIIQATDPLALIYNEGQWRINKVSPLYNLQYDSVKLKQYATKIRHAVVSSVALNSTIKYTVQCESQELLKFSEDDSSGLMITISSSPENNNKSKVAFVAILLSWGSCSRIENAIHLPYMLERGEQKLSTAVKSTLQSVFDCNIKQFSFTQNHLLKFCLYLLETDNSRSEESFVLTYKTPESDLKDKLNLSFHLGDVKIIWNGVKNEVLKQSDLVNTAYEILQNQIFHMISLDVSVVDLCRVALPKAEVRSNGMVKLKSPDSVNCFFVILNDISNVNIRSGQVDVSS